MSNRLFVVDANLAVQKLVEYSLSKEGFEVTAFVDGLSALDASDRIRPDIFIAEYNIAGIDIVKFCEKVKKKDDLKECPILLLVNESDIYDEERLRSTGIVGFIKKPLESIDLIAKAKRYLKPKREDEEALIGEEEIVRMEELLGWSSSTGSTSLFTELKDEKESGLLDFAEATKEEEKPAKIVNDLIFVEEEVEGERGPTVKEDEPRKEDISSYAGQIPDDRLERMIKEVAKELVEKIAWEVVPTLAEIAIKKELEKIKGEEG